MITSDEQRPSAPALAAVATDQALNELNRLLAAAVEHHAQGNSLAASSSLIAMMSVADPLISKLRSEWLNTPVAVPEPDEGVCHEPGLYL